MRRLLPLLAAAASLLLAALAAAPVLAGGGPAETVVLVNANSPDSRRVAERYAAARQIPPSQVLEVRCTPDLTTSIADFARDVVEPLRAFLLAHDLEDRVRFVVLTQGMPIRAKTAAGEVSTAAALALLHTPVCGSPQRGLRWRNPDYTGAVLPPGQPPTAPTDRFLHVGALLSTTTDEALALIDRSVASDGTAPKDALFVYQDASGNASTRNGGYDDARKEVEALGEKTVHLPAGADKAVNLKRVMGYMAGGSYSALSAQGVATNEYLPGAICDHLQSFGAVPQNFDPDAKRHTQFPVTHMVRAGITAVHGAVAEPFTIAFPDPDLFTAYVRGATVAETFDARCPIAYWMNLLLGDPLCAPFAERPKVTVEGAPKGTWTGDVKLRAKAPGARRIDVYLDGAWAAGGDGESLDAVVDTFRAADGERQVLVEATGAGDWAPRGWTALTAKVANPALHATALPARVASPFRVPLSRAPAAGETPVVTLTAGGASVPGKCAADGAAVVFTPDGPLPAGPFEASISGVAKSETWTVVPAASSAKATAPADAAVGTVPLRVEILAGGNRPAAGWRGRVEVRSADPPVRLAAVDATADAEGVVVVPLTVLRAGASDVSVTLPQDGVETTARLDVRAGAPVSATSPMSAVPQGQPFDLVVDVLDAAGNRADGYEGDVAVALPGDPDAVVPGTAHMTKDDHGRIVFRDVVLTRAGGQRLVITDGAGKQWSQPSEGLDPQHTAVRAWLVAQAAPAADATKLAASDPAKDADRDGCVAAGRLWRRLRARGDDVALPSQGAKDGDAVAAVTFVRAAAAAKVRLLGASAAPLTVLLDGKTVFDGAPKAADVKGKREALCDVTLSEGLHRLTVIAQKANRAAGFSLEIDDGGGKHADGVVVLAAASDEAPATCVASGRVRRGGGGIAGATVTVKGSDGAERTATTGADGTWYVQGLPAGAAEVRATWKHPLQPAARTVTLGGGNSPDLDFVARDDAPPVVKIPAHPSKFGRQLVVEPEIEDDDGVRDARLLFDGVEFQKLTAPPWRLVFDTTGQTRGRHRVVVVATDPSGNEGRSAPFEVTLIDDAKGPVVKLSGLSNNAELKRKADVTATVTDDLPIAEVRFRLDGKDLGAPRTEPPWTCEVEPKGLRAGAHSLAVSAKDLDGNETLVELKFRTK